MQAAGRASHRMRNTLICALPLAHQPAVVDAPIRRLHARWRQPALVAECHPVLGPTSRKTPTRR